ncbi:hypothetical protein [Vallitalea longa]|uniref:hypothetical protein n=1 Tax=Vallitalea longa TaxID=2936439 RepID=UPI0024933902|nr:hypothetical protein [Vallitalea longa]
MDKIDFDSLIENEKPDVKKVNDSKDIIDFESNNETKANVFKELLIICKRAVNNM